MKYSVYKEQEEKGVQFRLIEEFGDIKLCVVNESGDVQDRGYILRIREKGINLFDNFNGAAFRIETNKGKVAMENE